MFARVQETLITPHLPTQRQAVSLKLTQANFGAKPRLVIELYIYWRSVIQAFIAVYNQLTIITPTC
jgi:hypothetical protein